MQQTYPFQPRGGAASTTSIAVTAAAQNLTLPVVSQEGGTVLLTNIGTQTVFISFSGAATIAGSMPVIANTQVSCSVNLLTLSVIAAAAGSTLYATIGDGI